MLPMPSEPSVRPTRPDAHMVGALGEAARRLARQPVLGQQLAGQRQHEGDDRDGNRAAHAVRRDDQRDAGIRAGIDVDRVVADAETGDQRRAVRFSARCRRRNDGRAGSARRNPRAGRRVSGLRDSRNAISTSRARAQRLEIEIGIGRRPVGLPEITGERDPELCVGHRPPRLTCSPRGSSRPRRPARRAAPRRRPNSR